ncbi:hypothetical protein PP301_gp113 [Gordonia phage GMA2]|uniref:Uncharacterized protein n=1 Tax=Gordonia phage GMA2 TaxID=1647283 RepID=A0A0K0N6P3_9CAUD|nr:hypothetical protein PP301_gp113 [Gordonia phage GMA2]AKJ72609.1 hypothetical protein GMA2_71 [Gordonia phage GMA2]
MALTRDQHIVCKNKSCDSQNLLARVLEESPVDVHVVKLTNREFSISHPLYENVDDLSLDCRLVHDLKYSAIPPHAPGVYYVTLSASDEWVWERRDD